MCGVIFQACRNWWKPLSKEFKNDDRVHCPFYPVFDYLRFLFKLGNRFHIIAASANQEHGR